MCNRDERGPAELHYQSSICPHPYYKFHVDEREKTLRPSILFFHILGFESGRGFSEELRHRVVSKVREYEDIWLFLNVLQQVYKRKKDIPPRYYGDPQSTSNYLMFCDEDIQDPVSEQLKHYASPKGAHKQLHLFTHWFEYVDLGKELSQGTHSKGRHDYLHKLERTIPKNCPVISWWHGDLDACEIFSHVVQSSS